MHAKASQGNADRRFPRYRLDEDTSGASLTADHGSIWACTRAGPEVAGLLLARAAAVCLPNDATAEASRQDSVALIAGLNVVRRSVGWRGESAGGEKSDGWDSEELHFESLLFVECVQVLKL
ncbi:hypothetical protein E8E14_001597 [Neopestalotiopsis sp. 37M]|nr:hypothetical protein E8E14_001597 [Neopestalotiopsis sp. 37M]